LAVQSQDFGTPNMVVPRSLLWHTCLFSVGRLLLLLCLPVLMKVWSTDGGQRMDRHFICGIAMSTVKRNYLDALTFAVEIFALKVSCTLRYFLFLSGDINPNPGRLWQHPCAVCGISVRSNQRIILCDGCGLWCHCRCCGVDKVQYDCFQVQVDFSWVCPSCLSKTLPFNNCSQSRSKAKKVVGPHLSM